MQVWILLRGEQGEGGSVLGVFKRPDDAERVALSQEKFADGNWELVSVGKTWKYWQNGRDFVEILQKAVLG